MGTMSSEALMPSKGTGFKIILCDGQVIRSKKDYSVIVKGDYFSGSDNDGYSFMAFKQHVMAIKEYR
jgi:hypothetical protein